jgi:hypothetical protein
VLGSEVVIREVNMDLLAPPCDLLMSLTEGFMRDNDSGIGHLGIFTHFGPAELHNEFLHQLPGVPQVQCHIHFLVNLILI